MITKEIATSLGYHRELYHVRVTNSGGTPARCRVNGKCKTWKRDPERWELPVKHGLRDCFYLSPRNAHEWSTEESCQLAIALGLDPDTPAGIIADYLTDQGRDDDAALVRRGCYSKVKVHPVVAS